MSPPLPSYRISVRQNLQPAVFRGKRLKALVRRALGRLSPRAADIRILVVGDEDMKRWNRQYLGRPRTTNVLSFPEDGPEEATPGRLAGDILISAPTCLRQTEGWPGSPEERLFFFIVHGMLHLGGYNHERGPGEARRMRKAEREVYRSALGRDAR